MSKIYINQLKRNNKDKEDTMEKITIIQVKVVSQK